MFLTEDDWKAAESAADIELQLAIDQGYITWVSPQLRKTLSRNIAKAVILVGGREVEIDGDILDGELIIGLEGVVESGQAP